MCAYTIRVNESEYSSCAYFVEIDVQNISLYTC